MSTHNWRLTKYVLFRSGAWPNFSPFSASQSEQLTHSISCAKHFIQSTYCCSDLSRASCQSQNQFIYVFLGIWPTSPPCTTCQHFLLGTSTTVQHLIPTLVVLFSTLCSGRVQAQPFMQTHCLFGATLLNGTMPFCAVSTIDTYEATLI